MNGGGQNNQTGFNYTGQPQGASGQNLAMQQPQGGAFYNPAAGAFSALANNYPRYDYSPRQDSGMAQIQSQPSNPQIPSSYPSSAAAVLNPTPQQATPSNPAPNTAQAMLQQNPVQNPVNSSPAVAAANNMKVVGRRRGKMNSGPITQYSLSNGQTITNGGMFDYLNSINARNGQNFNYTGTTGG